jgi:redox-sensitive bicupin YhaK (pirin superfamily)
VALPAEAAAHVLVLPITGAVQAGAAPTPLALVEVEALCVLTVPAGGTLTLRNPYPDAQITCLHIWVAAAPAPELAATQVVAFQAEALTNQLLSVLPVAGHSLPFRASLGRFAGRAEGTYQLQNSAAGFFAFVLAGAFEVAGRLLHAQDGLALWDVPAIELEALSNDALVLVLELTP